MHTFKEHQSSIKSFGVHSTGRFFVSGSRDGVVKFWKIDDPSCESKSTYTGHKHAVVDVAFVDRFVIIISFFFECTKCW